MLVGHLFCGREKIRHAFMGSLRSIKGDRLRWRSRHVGESGIKIVKMILMNMCQQYMLQMTE